MSILYSSMELFSKTVKVRPLKNLWINTYTVYIFTFLYIFYQGYNKVERLTPNLFSVFLKFSTFPDMERKFLVKKITQNCHLALLLLPIP